MEELRQLLMAFLGSLAFSLLFNVRGKKLLPAALGGVISWGVFLLAKLLAVGETIGYLIAATVLTLYAEMMARLLRSPSTVFLVCAAIPLIPGGGLYETMRYAVAGQWENFFGTAMNTLALSLAIAGGILLGTTLVHAALQAMRRLRVTKG